MNGGTTIASILSGDGGISDDLLEEYVGYGALSAHRLQEHLDARDDDATTSSSSSLRAPRDPGSTPGTPATPHGHGRGYGYDDGFAGDSNDYNYD